ncbi:MarR family winged helix-turn-helix transcriptional regulator [Roseibium algae]|uniref:MarR family transcriptional regulator n=1 Tax=Roseibium algae TaxID=3123038 RepID=A0ABU8TPD1_9HYPH
MADQAEQTPPDEQAHDYVLDEQIGFLLRKAYQRNAVIFSEKVQTGLTPTQFAVMSRLSEITSVSQNQLGRLVGLDVATTKGVIDRLLGRDLVKSERDPNDRRRQLISLTAEGWAQFLATVPLGHEVTADTLAPLTQAEQKSLARLLKKIT